MGLFKTKITKDHYKPVRVRNVFITIILNTKVAVIKKRHQLKNTWKKYRIKYPIINNLKNTDIGIDIINNRY